MASRMHSDEGDDMEGAYSIVVTTGRVVSSLGGYSRVGQGLGGTAQMIESAVQREGAKRAWSDFVRRRHHQLEAPSPPAPWEAGYTKERFNKYLVFPGHVKWADRAKRLMVGCR